MPGHDGDWSTPEYTTQKDCYQPPTTEPSTKYDGHELVAQYTAALDQFADEAADRAAVVRTRIATLEAELVALDGLATMIGDS